MNGSTDIHPDAVLESLLAKGARSNKRESLTKMHDLCRKRHEAGSREFSLPAVGRVAEAEGIMKGRALYNAQSADYAALIQAWAAYAGPPAPKPLKALASHEYLMRIDDPAIRSIMQAIIVERDKLKAQINVLKANTHVTVDRRPLGATVVSVSPKETVAVLTMDAQLTDSERKAMASAISPEFLADQGWREGSHGEILNERGRTVFEVGYARAIRKVLGG